MNNFLDIWMTVFNSRYIWTANSYNCNKNFIQIKSDQNNKGTNILTDWKAGLNCQTEKKHKCVSGLWYHKNGDWLFRILIGRKSSILTISSSKKSYSLNNTEWKSCIPRGPPTNGRTVGIQNQ